jgi:mono/diheme cytochrome c family protein
MFWRITFIGLYLIFAASFVLASDAAINVDLTSLEKVDTNLSKSNPYRGSDSARLVGQNIYAQVCQVCHGEKALGKGPGPNLRRLANYCKRIEDAKLQSECMVDNDRYFVKSVVHGKIKLGVEHMPAWGKTLSPEMIWALKTYIDSPVEK